MAFREADTMGDAGELLLYDWIWRRAQRSERKRLAVIESARNPGCLTATDPSRRSPASIAENLKA